MKKSLFLIAFFCTCLLGGCKKTGSIAYTGTPVFERHDTIQPVVLATGLEMVYPIQTFAVDSIIIVVDMMGYDHYVQVFDDNGNLLKKMAKTGRGPGEIIEFRDCAFDKKNKTLSLYRPGKITEYNLNLLLKDSLAYFREIPVADARETGGFSSNARLLGEDRVFWVGSSPEKRFAISKGQDYLVYDHYPAVSEDKRLDASISVYGETIAFNENMDRFAKATYIGGILETFQIDGTRIIPHKISYIYEPIPKKLKGSNDITWGEETTIGFEAMDCTDDYIYTILNGLKGTDLKNADVSDPPFTDHISVFDWEGNPRKSISLDKKLMTVAALNDSTLYLVAFNDGFSLMKVNL